MQIPKALIASIGELANALEKDDPHLLRKAAEGSSQLAINFLPRPDYGRSGSAGWGAIAPGIRKDIGRPGVTGSDFLENSDPFEPVPSPPLWCRRSEKRRLPIVLLSLLTALAC